MNLIPTVLAHLVLQQPVCHAKLSGLDNETLDLLNKFNPFGDCYGLHSLQGLQECAIASTKPNQIHALIKACKQRWEDLDEKQFSSAFIRFGYHTATLFSKPIALKDNHEIIRYFYYVQNDWPEAAQTDECYDIRYCYYYNKGWPEAAKTDPASQIRLAYYEYHEWTDSDAMFDTDPYIALGYSQETQSCLKVLNALNTSTSTNAWSAAQIQCRIGSGYSPRALSNIGSGCGLRDQFSNIGSGCGLRDQYSCYTNSNYSLDEITMHINQQVALNNQRTSQERYRLPFNAPLLEALTNIRYQQTPAAFPILQCPKLLPEACLDFRWLDSPHLSSLRTMMLRAPVLPNDERTACALTRVLNESEATSALGLLTLICTLHFSDTLLTVMEGTLNKDLPDINTVLHLIKELRSIYTDVPRIDRAGYLSSDASAWLSSAVKTQQV